MHLPIDFHGLVTLRANIVNKAETDEWTGVTKTILFVLAYKEQKLLTILFLLDEALSLTRV